MDSFSAHTFSTGVFGGFGVNLFSDRVNLSKQLLSDPSPAIRIWAEQHLRASEHMHQDAVRRETLHEASIETGE